MLTPEERLREGNVEEALRLLQDRVQAEPASAKHRVFLFQLLSVMGRWDRALNQLEVLREMDPGSLAMVHIYGDAVRSEALRKEIFAGRRSPVLFGEPEPWLALLVEALRLAGAGRWVEAATLRDRSLEEATAVGGAIDGVPFEWIADADSRLGPVLEVVLNGKYTWIPFHRIREIHMEKPTDLRDMVWAPATFMWSNGGEAPGLVPVRYAGSESATDSGLVLSRKTEWTEPATGVFIGLGQRMLATDHGEYALLDVREIRLEAEAQTVPAAEAGG